MKRVISNCLLLLSVLLLTSLMVEAQMCNPSGKIRGEKPPGNQCNRDHGSDCCKEGELYTTYECSPPVSELTTATLTLNGFEKGGDGGDPSACDGKFHKDNTPVVALSTGWFNDYKRCEKFIIIHGNSRSTEAMVVDECDSTMGCDKEHSYQPPCQNDIVDASEAVWQALGVDENDKRYGYMEITWTDA